MPPTVSVFSLSLTSSAVIRLRSYLSLCFLFSDHEKIVQEQVSLSYEDGRPVLCSLQVSLSYEDGRPVDGKGLGRKVIDRVQETYASELAGKYFAYDGEKSLFTIGPLPRNSLNLSLCSRISHPIDNHTPCCYSQPHSSSFYPL
ncbi:Protein argonaute, N-terminal [Dillenia turbinata]|uniref:Protein argonaute, N-terminal n=1 Tax=Dillenia turbinata TaxID=194707 RepID=A0AAN8ZUE8_9MAGN